MPYCVLAYSQSQKSEKSHMATIVSRALREKPKPPAPPMLSAPLRADRAPFGVPQSLVRAISAETTATLGRIIVDTMGDPARVVNERLLIVAPLVVQASAIEPTQLLLE